MIGFAKKAASENGWGGSLLVGEVLDLRKGIHSYLLYLQPHLSLYRKLYASPTHEIQSSLQDGCLFSEAVPLSPSDRQFRSELVSYTVDVSHTRTEPMTITNTTSAMEILPIIRPKFYLRTN